MAADPIRKAWAAHGYTPFEIDVLALEGFTLEQPPTAKERLAVGAMARRRECARAARLTGRAIHTARGWSR